MAQILDVAVEYGYLPANPARGKRRKLKADRPKRPYLDSARQIVALLDAAADLDRESRADRQHVNRRAQLATLVFAGLRISEFLALRWRDVDLAGGWLTVGQSKTEAGRRKVKIRPVLRDVLAELRVSSPDITPPKWGPVRRAAIRAGLRQPSGPGFRPTSGLRSSFVAR